MATQEAIKSNKMLLVEGKDEIHFFNALLKHLAIDAYVTCAEGKDNIANEYETQIKRSGFSAVTRMGFVRDAETQAAELPFKEICKVMKEYTPELPVPEKIGTVVSSGEYRTGIFIMPDCSKPGMIEDLCLASAANEELLTKAQVYVAGQKVFILQKVKLQNNSTDQKHSCRHTLQETCRLSRGWELRR